MPTKFTTSPYLDEQIPLASLFTDLETPHQNNEAPGPLNLPILNVHFKSRNDSSYTLDSSNRTSTTILARLTKLVSGMYNTTEDRELDIDSVTTTVTELIKPTEFFETLCKDKNVLQWIRRNGRGMKPIYFVSGKRTFDNAKVVIGSYQSSEVTLQGALPAAEILAGGTPLPPAVGEAVNPSVAMSHEQGSSADEKYTAEGKRVFAIGYQKVSYRSFLGQIKKNPGIGKVQWYITTRGTKDSDESEVGEAFLEGGDQAFDWEI